MNFDIASIEVNASTSKWGPYVFSFKGALPDPNGDQIQSAEVRSYLNGTETTAQLIDRSLVESPVVKVWFNYPGENRHGKHTVVFILTLSKGGVKSFEFGYVDVE